MTESAIRAGQILMAEPFMLDPYFRRSVVLITERRDDGTVGFILNKSVEMSVNELVADFPEFDAEVYYGGPVQTDTLHFVHSVGGLLDDSIPVSKGVWWGGDFEKLKFLIDQGLVDARQIRFFVGYSGWSKGQLEGEMKRRSWVLADGDPNYVFRVKPRKLWAEALKNQSASLGIIGQMPETTHWN